MLSKLSYIRNISISLCLSFMPNMAFTQSVTDILQDSHKKDLNSADVTIFAFAYSRIKEADKIMSPMMASPTETLDQMCKYVYQQNTKSPLAFEMQKKAVQWVYMNNIAYYKQILEDLNTVEKELTLSENPEIGPVTQSLITLLKQRREILDIARNYGWSSEFLMTQLEKNDIALDTILIDSGSKIAMTAFDTFHEINFSKFPTVETGIYNIMYNSCLEDPISQENAQKVL